jgi:hypothetical protein
MLSQYPAPRLNHWIPVQQKALSAMTGSSLCFHVAPASKLPSAFINKHLDQKVGHPWPKNLTRGEGKTMLIIAI